MISSTKLSMPFPDTVVEDVSFKHDYYVESVENLKSRPVYDFVKRLLDIIFSALGIAVLIIPVFIIGIIVKVDSKGKVIYKQERLGKDGEPFMLYKIRSMVDDAEANGVQWAEENDERVTRVGAFLRLSRIDELPQLINIFLGQMSFVGPRPERLCFYEEFEQYIHGFGNRLAVKPGLTGLAQVNGGYDLLPEEKIVYDIEYIKKRNIFMDIKCTVKTLFVVFSKNGAR